MSYVLIYQLPPANFKRAPLIGVHPIILKLKHGPEGCSGVETRSRSHPGYTLNKLPIRHRHNTERQPHTSTITPVEL